MSDAPGAPATYGVVIASYNRHDILPICIEHVLRQGLLPKEIIIVDATAEWAPMRERIAEMVHRAAPDVAFQYVPAAARSLTAQRNQGIALATADVLFLIDDDSLMFPECAREIMAIYHADRTGDIAGVQAALAAAAPSSDSRLPEQKAVGGMGWAPSGALLNWINRYVFMMAADQLFLPYWGRLPAKPPRIEADGAYVVPLLQGCRMTYRREVIARERFDQDLEKYAAAEDLDASYRASRHGVLLEAERARIYHHTVASGRLSRGHAAELSAMNIAFLLRKNAGAGGGPLLRLYSWLGRRLFAEFLKDALSRRFALPQWRAMLHTSGSAWRLWTVPPSELSKRYAAIQESISRRYSKNRPG